MTKKDIAIIGGSFDPVHNGHIEMVKYFVDNYIVDEVWLLPSYNSPHKENDSIISFNDRVNMLSIAINGIKNTYINTFEEEYFNKFGSKTYTYDVLNELKKKYLNMRFHFVVGFDSIKSIYTWYKYSDLLKDYWFYIFDREDSEFTTKEQKKYYLNNLGKNMGINFFYELFDVKITNISSTEIRNLLQDIDNNYNLLLKYINKDVLKYIKENKLYGIC